MENYEDLIGKRFKCEGWGGVYELVEVDHEGDWYFKYVDGGGPLGYLLNSKGLMPFKGFPPSFKLIEDEKAE